MLPVLITTLAMGEIAAVQATPTASNNWSHSTVRDLDQSNKLVLDDNEKVSSLGKRALGFDRFAYQAPTSTSIHQSALTTGLTDGRFPRIEDIMKRNVGDVDMLGQDDAAHVDQLLPRRFHPLPRVNITIQTATSTGMTVPPKMLGGNNDTGPSSHARKVVNLDPSHMAYWTMKLSTSKSSRTTAVTAASTSDTDLEYTKEAQDQSAGQGVVTPITPSVTATLSSSPTTTAAGQAEPIFMGRAAIVPYAFVPSTYYSDAESIPVAGIAAFALAVALAGAVILL